MLWKKKLQVPAPPKLISVGGLVASVDLKETSQQYWKTCHCEGCLHYIAHAATAFPGSFCEFLAAFGLDPDNAAYTTVTDSLPEQLMVRFEGHFVVIGELSGGQHTEEFEAGQGCVYWLSQTAWTGGTYGETYKVPHLDEPHFFINFKALFPGSLAEEEGD